MSNITHQPNTVNKIPGASLGKLRNPHMPGKERVLLAYELWPLDMGSYLSSTRIGIRTDLAPKLVLKYRAQLCEEGRLRQEYVPHTYRGKTRMRSTYFVVPDNVETDLLAELNKDSRLPYVLSEGARLVQRDVAHVYKDDLEDTEDVDAEATPLITPETFVRPSMPTEKSITEVIPARISTDNTRLNIEKALIGTPVEFLLTPSDPRSQDFWAVKLEYMTNKNTGYTDMNPDKKKITCVLGGIDFILNATDRDNILGSFYAGMKNSQRSYNDLKARRNERKPKAPKPTFDETVYYIAPLVIPTDITDADEIKKIVRADKVQRSINDEQMKKDKAAWFVAQQGL
jgi:hypothetical protein